MVNLGEIESLESNLSSANEFYLEGITRFETANEPSIVGGDLEDGLQKNLTQSREEQAAYFHRDI